MFRIFLGVIAAALFGFIVLVVVFWPFTKSKVQAAIEEEWPGQVQIGSFRPVFFPHPGCVVRSVTLSLRSGSQSLRVVTIEEGQLESRYADFLMRPHYIARVMLQGLRVELPEESEWRGLHGATSGSKGNPNTYGEVFADNSSLAIARSGGAPLLFLVHRLKLNGYRSGSGFAYEIALHNPLPQAEVQAAGKFGPWNSQDLGRSPLSGGYTLRDGNLGDFTGISGTLSSSGHFTGVLGAIEVTGKTDVPNFAVAHNPHAVSLSTAFSAVVNGKNGDVVLRQVDAGFLDTRMVVKGSIARPKHKHGKFASLDLDIARGRINDVLRLFVKAPQPPMRGAGQFRAHVEIPPGPQPFLKRVDLQADFVVHDASFTSPERQEGLNDLSRRASGKKEKGKTGSDPAEPPVKMDLQSRLQLVGGVAHFTGLQMNIPGAEAHLAGNYVIASEKVDLHGNLRTDTALSKETSGIKSLLLKPLDPLFKKKKAGADVPVGITGTYDDAHFAIELPSKKPPAAPPPAGEKR